MPQTTEMKHPTDAAPAHTVASREAWLEARLALLERERALTHERDAIAAARRALPWVRVDKAYVFQAPEGPRTLSELFDGRSQLAVYHFMLPPDSDHICPGCSFLADGVDAARQHFEHADLSFVAVSRARIERIEDVRERMGWRFRWVSSHGADFNRDFGVQVSAEDAAASRSYNFGVGGWGADLPGTSIFAQDATGQVFHTYSSYARGGDILLGAMNWLDLTPKGRNETTTMSWLRLHDEYEGAAHVRCGGGH